MCWNPEAWDSPSLYRERSRMYHEMDERERKKQEKRKKREKEAEELLMKETNKGE